MMILEPLSNPAPARRFYLVLGLLSAAAWALLVAWQNSNYAELLGHESLGDHHLPYAWRLAAFLLSWSLMTVAMMLPGSLPTLIHTIRPARQRMQSTWLVGWIILGYLAPWVLFGLLAFLGDSVLHELVEPEGPLAAFSDIIAPAIIFTAGLYQFTPYKLRYLERCRPSQPLEHTGEEQVARGTGIFTQGLRLGIYCTASCWALMLLMFAVGHHRLDWMLALGGILAAERLAPWGPRLAWLVGFGLIVWAALWMFSA